MFFLLLALCGTGMLHAQNVLPGYRGFWEQSRRITVVDLVEYYPDQLPLLRNEIYARYGRAFTTQSYRDHFRAQSWYQEKSNFSESWLTQNDRENAALILSLEQSARGINDVAAQVLRNIEYSGGSAILTFTSRQQLVWSDRNVDYGPYGVSGFNKQTIPWFAMGDWVLIYQLSFNGYNVVAYKLDHGTRKIIGDAVGGWVDSPVLERLLRAQGRSL